MTRESFYLSYYQAILDSNLQKAIKLERLSALEIEDYPKEHTNLNYEEIFKNNDPNIFLASILGTEEFIYFYRALSELLRNPLATEENIAIREENKLELMKYPLIDYCPNHAFGLLAVDALLSFSYSSLLNAKAVASDLTNIMNQSVIIEDVLSVVATFTTIDSSRPFSIALVNKDMNEYDPTEENTTGGYNSSVQNKLIVTNENIELNLEFMIHELAHKAMDIVFKNGSDPYNSAVTKEKYHNAIKNTLLNIQAFIKQDFGLDIIFKNENDTWQMGKTLSTILFPQYLDEENIQNFISALQQYNLNINDEFSWLNDGCTPLGLMLGTLRFGLASALFEAGASIPPETIHKAAIFSPKYAEGSLNILNWVLENAKEININYRDQLGMTALDYTENPQMIKVLISVGAIAYPPNYQPVCSIDIDKNESITVEEEELSALETLLNFYNQDQAYGQSEEDAEFIVRLPQIIAGGLYKGKIVEVLEPLAEYWQEVISPAVVVYQEQYDISENCLATLDYVDFLSSY